MKVVTWSWFALLHVLSQFSLDPLITLYPIISFLILLYLTPSKKNWHIQRESDIQFYCILHIQRKIRFKTRFKMTFVFRLLYHFCIFKLAYSLFSCHIWSLICTNLYIQFMVPNPRFCYNNLWFSVTPNMSQIQNSLLWVYTGRCPVSHFGTVTS